MCVLFLDIDGVLNSRLFLVDKPASEWPTSHLDPSAVSLLNSIVGRTGCRIVISSTWRNAIGWKELSRVLKSVGFLYPESIIGQTSRANMDNRGMEIALWLNEHPEIKNFVILDDDADMAHLIGHLVQTDWEVGLTAPAAETVTNRLTKK